MSLDDVTDVTLDDDLDACWKGTMKIIELHTHTKMHGRAENGN